MLKYIKFSLGFLFSFIICFEIQEKFLTEDKFLIPKNLIPNFLSEKFYPEQDILKIENPIFENTNGLKPFFEKLKILENKKNNKVKIIHYGDSLIWGDILTSKIKSRFQEKFGNGGLGLVPIFEYRERYFSDYKNFNSERNFQKFHLNHRQNKNEILGFLGEGFIPNSNQFSLNYKSDFEEIEIYLRSLDKLKSPEIEIENQNYKTEKFGLSTKLFLENKNETIKLKSNQKLVLDTVGLENKSGLVYSSVARQGIELVDLQILDENFSSINLYNPDLIILQFGINESQNIYTKNFLNLEKYKTDLENTILFIQNKSKAKILLISPFERVYPNGKPMIEILDMISVQKEILQKYKIPYLNLYELLGGKGQNEKLFLDKIIQSDRTHLTLIGGEKIGNLIYEEIESEYFKFLGQEKIKKDKSDKEKLNKAILFNSKEFFYFFLTVLILSFILPKFRIYIFGLASIYFYSSYNFDILALLLISILIAYLVGIKIEKANLFKKNLVLSIAIIFFLGILIYFKYTYFILSILKIPIYLKIILPVGISFYTFQLISYLVDIYRKDINPEKNFFKFLLYILFFPQLVAGPIIRAKDFLTKFNNQTHFKIKFFHFKDGVFLFSIGILKKLLADNLSDSGVDKIFSTPEMFSTTEILVGIYSFTAQIYLDFSGYSDMAIGLAKILGFRLTKNFNLPYSAFTITEFWKKWHISLSNWFRDYLYIPLGGNKKNIFSNLWVVMLLCGLWHGASFTFIIWGFFHGLILILERIFYLRESKNLFRKFLTFNLVTFGWVIFRTSNLDSLYRIFNSIIQFKFYFLNQEFWVLAFLILFFIYQFFGLRWIHFLRKKNYKLDEFIFGSSFGLILITVIYFSKLNTKAFIYFEF